MGNLRFKHLARESADDACPPSEREWSVLRLDIALQLETDNSTFQQREFVTPGGVYSAQLFTDGPVPANQWVLIRAGTRSSDGSITNDMEINSLSVFKWFLQAVHVRIAS